MPPLSAADPPPLDPLSLVGWWRVEGTEQIVLVDPSAIEVVEGCRTSTGRWQADPEARFVASIDFGDASSCAAAEEAVAEAPEWLAEAAGFAVDGPDRVLLGRAGAETARLLPAPPTAGSGMVDPARAPTDEERRAMGSAAPVPSSLRAAAPAELVGRWIPESHPGPTEPFVELSEDGSWTGSDGCNGSGGAWVAGSGGGLLATALGVHTLIACDDAVDVGSLLFSARRAAFDGAVLVLLDAGGEPVGRFQRV